MDLELALWPKQVEAIREISRPGIERLLYGGARGGGKSHLARAYLLWRAAKYPKSNHLIVRRSFPELFRTHTLRFQQDYGKFLTHQERFHRFTLGNGSVIEYGYAENIRDCDKWQGSEFATIVVDEAQFMELEILNYFRTINRTTIPDLECKQLWTANPGGRSHVELKRLYIDRRFEDSEDPDAHAYVRALVSDNPSLGEDYVDQLKQLPEHLRRAYLEGDWDALLGSFFSFHPDVYEEPYDLTDTQCREGLYASLDYGVAHYTSFGLLYLDDTGRTHRLFHYLANETTADENASEIADRIATFPHTKGAWPLQCFADASMWGEQRLTKNEYWRPIDAFMKAMPKVRFTPATREKIWSSQILKGMLDPNEGEPTYVVWRPYNQDWAEWMAQAEIDRNRPETYLKAAGDDVADETRYGAAGCYSLHNEAERADKARARARATMQSRRHTDWYSM